jgi:hypothetical protein
MAKHIRKTLRAQLRDLFTGGLLAALTLSLVFPPVNTAFAGVPHLPAQDNTAGDFYSLPPTTNSSAKPNVLIILDNSNSMDEDATGAAVSWTDPATNQVYAGSAAPTSRSEMARTAIKAVIDQNKNSMRFGLMAYDQQGIVKASLSNSLYYASYDPRSYQPNSPPPAQHNSPTKTQKSWNPSDPDPNGACVGPDNNRYNCIYYNTALPFYDTSQGTDNQYCYSWNYTEDDLLGYCNELGECCDPATQYCALNPDHPPIGSCDGNSCFGNDMYACYPIKKWQGASPLPWAGQPTGPGNTPPNGLTTAFVTNFTTQYGYGGLLNYFGVFGPTDDDLAQGFKQFGYENASIYVGPAWFSTAAVGGGRLHVNIEDSSNEQIAKLNAKLDRSQFINPTDTPLRNAGTTPLPGTINTAWNYFAHNAVPTATDPVTGAVQQSNPIDPALPCQKNFIVLVTDGLPSADADGNPATPEKLLSDTVESIQKLHNVPNEARPNANLDVQTFVIGLAMGQNAAALNQMATAGGTGTAYNADDQESLNNALTVIFQQIAKGASSGTAAAINTNSRSGAGGAFPSIFYPQMQEQAGHSINWAGDVVALFVDKNGRLREDSSSGDHILYDTGNNANRIVKYQQNAVGFATPVDAKPEISVFTMPNALALKGTYFLINAVGGRHYYVCFNVDNDVVADSTVNGGGTYRQRLEVPLAAGDQPSDVAQKTARVLNNSMVFTATAANAQSPGELTITNILPGNPEDASAGSSGITPVITQGSDAGATNTLVGDRTNVKYLWTASDWLASISDADITQQRAYASPEKKRYIITFTNDTEDSVPTAATGAPFVVPDEIAIPADGTIPQSEPPEQRFARLIPVSDDTHASTSITGIPAASGPDYMKAQIKRVINFIRGQDQPAAALADGTSLPAFRSRQIDYSGWTQANQILGAGAHTWRLGDIIHSDPLVVNRPNQGYKSIYGDDSYAQFMAKYANRRTVVYVGANDGMLHAFNGGFYEDRYSANDAHPTTGTPVMRYSALPKKLNQAGALVDDASVVKYDLGAELWAYVPYNLLGHLYWLTQNTQTTSSHVYYVDLPSVAYDVKIFTDDGPNGKHPGGWGTILVGGMGFGGGRIDACTSRDWTNGGVCKSYEPMSSAYFIFDITDPENEPRLLTEFALPRQGYTTNVPALAYFQDQTTTPATMKAYLVFGSGPATGAGRADGGALLATAQSGQNARLFYLQLPAAAELAASWQKKIVSTPSGSDYLKNCVSWASQECSLATIGANPATNGEPAYVSDMVAVDTKLDYNIDVLYYGTVVSPKAGAADQTSLSGALRRIVTNNNSNPLQWSANDSSMKSVLIDLAAAAVTPPLRQPISAAPSTAFDAKGNLFVYFGTGRYLSASDQTNNDQQALYGVKEPRDSAGAFTWGTVDYSTLYDATPVTIQSADENGVEVTGGAGGSFSWQNFLGYTNSFPGWVHKLRTQADLAREGIIGVAERAVNQPAITNQLFLATTFVPTNNPNDPCNNLGLSYLYALYYRTGTAAMTKNGPLQFRYDLVGGLPSRLTVNNNGASGTTSDGGFFNVSLDTNNNPPIGEGTLGARRLDWRIISE